MRKTYGCFHRKKALRRKANHYWVLADTTISIANILDIKINYTWDASNLSIPFLRSVISSLTRWRPLSAISMSSSVGFFLWQNGERMYTRLMRGHTLSSLPNEGKRPMHYWPHQTRIEAQGGLYRLRWVEKEFLARRSLKTLAEVEGQMTERIEIAPLVAW